MELALQTGHTKAPSDVRLASLSFTSSVGESAFLLLHVEADPREAKSLEEEATAVIQHALLATEGEAWHRLDGTLKELNGLFKGFLVSGTVGEVHALVGIVDLESTLHVSHAGHAEAYLIRGGALSQVTEFTRGKPTPGFFHIASGPLESRDIVLCSTLRLLRLYTPAQLVTLSTREGDLLREVTLKVEEEKEVAALATLHIPGGAQQSFDEVPASVRSAGRRSMRRRSSLSALPAALSWVGPLVETLTSLTKQGAAGASRMASSARMPSLPGPALPAGRRQAGLPRQAGIPSKSRAVTGKQSTARVTAFFRDLSATLQPRFAQFLADLKHPERRKRAHLLLLATTVAAFLIVWAVVRLSTSAERRQTRAELSELVTEISASLQAAENRRLSGDIDAANAILENAQKEAKQVMDNESGLFRSEALDLLDRIRQKRDEIGNVMRLSPRTVVNLTAKNPDIAAQGIIHIGEGELAVYDRRATYRVLLNSVENPRTVTEDDLLLRGTALSRFNSIAFLTSGDNVIELTGGDAVSMKTEDPAGWMKGIDLESYLRFLYILSPGSTPQDGNIYKYERLSSRYGAPVVYNIGGDLTGALDMAIDGSVYVLKEGGQVVKFFRGEVQPWKVRHSPSEDLLKDATKIVKAPDHNFYILDPVKARIIVLADGGDTGEAPYVRQYVLEGTGTLQDIAVDADNSHLYVVDEKKVYVVDITR